MECNFMRIAEQTDEEKLKKYMKCTKKELAKMLIESNRIIQSYPLHQPVDLGMIGSDAGIAKLVGQGMKYNEMRGL